jgi:hypothetical protein
VGSLYARAWQTFKSSATKTAFAKVAYIVFAISLSLQNKIIKKNISNKTPKYKAVTLIINFLLSFAIFLNF